MLAIRMQRTGRKGYPTYRVIVQDSHRQPTSGRVVANLGSYNPHTKEVNLDKEKAATFLKNGAQPSDRVVKLLQAEKVALPSWVNVTSDKKQKTIRNSEKLRRNQPVAEKTEEPAEPEQPVEEVSVDVSVEQPAETPEAEQAEEPTEAPEEAPAEATEEAAPETESPVVEGTPEANAEAEESASEQKETKK